MLDTLDKGINIRDLNITEPSPRPEPPFFDPKRDITPEDWEEMKNRFSTDNFIWDKLELLYHLKTFAPEKVEEFSTDEVYKWMMKDVSTTNPTYGGMHHSINLLAPLLVIYPEKEKEIRALAEYFKVEMDLDLLNTSGDLAKKYLEFAIIFPKDYLPVIRSNEEIKTAVKSQIEAEHRNFSTGFYSNAGISALNPHALSVLASFRLLFPDEKINLTGSDQDAMKSLLDTFRQRKNWSVFAIIASAMNILAAEKAYLDEDGNIVINPPKPEKITEDIPALPEVRKF